VKFDSGIKGSINAGPLGVSGKIGAEASARNGISGVLSGEANASAASLKAGGKIDLSGSHFQTGAEGKSDNIIGGEFNVGFGIGVGINLTQAEGVLNVIGEQARNVTAFASDQLKGIFSTVSGQQLPSILPSTGADQ